jgi:hypothetical protein
LKVIVSTEVVLVVPASDSLIASLVLSVRFLESSRLPVLLSEIRTRSAWPAATVSVVRPRTTTFFLVFVLFAAIAISLPPLSVSIALTVSVLVQLEPVGPLQAMVTIAVVPVVFA